MATTRPKEGRGLRRKPWLLCSQKQKLRVSERAYLLAMLFGHEFEVEANEFSLQIASSAMMMVETDRSSALIACADLAAAEDDGR